MYKRDIVEKSLFETLNRFSSIEQSFKRFCHKKLLVTRKKRLKLNQDVVIKNRFIIQVSYLIYLQILMTGFVISFDILLLT